MKKLVVILTLFLLAQFAAAQTWENVTLMDAMCSTKAKANPDAHPRSCALQCSKAGYGILTGDGNFLKFDSAGNAKALELLKASDKADHLRVKVSGELRGDQLAVQTLSLQ